MICSLSLYWPKYIGLYKKSVAVLPRVSLIALSWQWEKLLLRVLAPIPVACGHQHLYLLLLLAAATPASAHVDKPRQQINPLECHNFSELHKYWATNEKTCGDLSSMRNFRKSLSIESLQRIQEVFVKRWLLARTRQWQLDLDRECLYRGLPYFF